MNSLRRVFGRSTNSGIPSQGVIAITHEDPGLASPPEPIIEAPVIKDKEAKKKTEAADQASAALPDTATLTGTRPLPPIETIVPKPGQHLLVGQLSDIGMVHSNNQDAMLTMLSASLSVDNLPELGLFIVADGMGGHHDGEKAAAIAVRIITRHVINEIFVPLLSNQMNDPDRPAIAEVLRAAVEEANEMVTEEIPDGGTTATTVIVLGDLAYIAHVGDSRAYMITTDGIEQITRDHSFVQRLIELDQITPEEAAEHPQRNVLYRALGKSESLDVDAITRRLLPRSRLLLCSDGLWNPVSEDMILDIVNSKVAILRKPATNSSKWQMNEAVLITSR